MKNNLKIIFSLIGFFTLTLTACGESSSIDSTPGSNSETNTSEVNTSSTYTSNSSNEKQLANFRGPNASSVVVDDSEFSHFSSQGNSQSVYFVTSEDNQLVTAENLYFETKICVVDNSLGDSHPKIGIALSTSAAPYNILEGRFIGHYFYLDLSGELGENKMTTYATANKPGTSGGWLDWGDGSGYDHRSYLNLNENYANEFLTFAIKKEGTRLSFYINNQEVQNFISPLVDGHAYVSILGLGCDYDVIDSYYQADLDPSDDPTKVLILGNSLVFYNNMPVIFENLARSGGKNISVQYVNKGSATISDYASTETDHGAKAHDLLLSQEYDYVVVEPSRRITPIEDSVFNCELEATKQMKKLAEDAGAELVLYAVWGDQDDKITPYYANYPYSPIAMGKGNAISYPRKEHVKFLQVDVAEHFAQEAGLEKIIKAGYAFENYYDSYPEVNLYDPDQRHPALSGSYLTAATIYATLFNESPVGLPYIPIPPAEKPNYAISQDFADKLLLCAKETVIDGKVPVLETNNDNFDYNVLVLGSGLMNDYNTKEVLTNLVKTVDGKDINYVECLDSSFVFNTLTNSTTDYGLRTYLNDYKFDAIILQISRRITESATDVIESELNALKTIYPLLQEETPNIYLMSYASEAKPSIFTTTGGVANYTKTSNKETGWTTKAIGCTWYSNLATIWVDAINEMNSEYKCSEYLYATVYSNANDQGLINKATVGYLMASSMYMTLFNKSYDDTTVLNTVGTDTMTSQTALTCRQIAEAVCL